MQIPGSAKAKANRHFSFQCRFDSAKRNRNNLGIELQFSHRFFRYLSYLLLGERSVHCAEPIHLDRDLIFMH
jgi:hypothetical protein